MTTEKPSFFRAWLAAWADKKAASSVPLPSRKRRLVLSGLFAAPVLYGLFTTGLFARLLPSPVAYAAGSPGTGGKKNILIITGSARINGNSDQLAEAFARGARAAGHEVAVFSPARNKIDGCIACDTCWSRGKPCSFDDGFDTLAPMLEQADMLVLCGPIYWYSFSTHLKSAIDKMYAYSQSQRLRKLKIKESALLMCGETWFEKPFEGAVASYKHIVRLQGWDNRGIMLVTRVHKRGAIADTDALARAEKMGLEI